jgi:hypothetical protein
MLLLLGTGQRCGSTLVQRLLCSHPDAFIWGEHGGELESMVTAAETVAAYSASLAGTAGRKDWAELGHQGFIANLIPDPQTINAAFRGFLESVFKALPESAGKRVWGYKEVRHDLDFARKLQRYFPDLRVILVVRDLRAILCSLDEWARRGRWSDHSALEITRRWERIIRSCLGSHPMSDLPVLTLRYEDYVAEPKQTSLTIGEFTGLDPEGFDMSVFAKRIHSHGADGSTARQLRAFDELPLSWRQLIDDDQLRWTAKQYGYSFAE